jgi:hypothetical protein
MKIPESASRKPFIGNRCLLGPHKTTVRGKIAEPVENSILEAIACTQHHNEHENTPEYAKGSKYRA